MTVKRPKKILSIILEIIMMTSNFTSLSAFATDVTAPTASPATTAEPTTSPAPTAEPTASPATTAEPTTSPATTAEPTASPATTAEPTASPATTAEPTASPATTAEPTASPAPTSPIKEITIGLKGYEGDTVEFNVVLNDETAIYNYQWQRAYIAPKEEVKTLYDYDNTEESNYFFPIANMTENELLAINPNAKWQGMEMYFTELEKMSGDSSKVKIKNGSENYVIKANGKNEVETFDVLSIDESLWLDIEGATDKAYSHVITAEDDTAFYRCVVTDKTDVASPSDTPSDETDIMPIGLMIAPPEETAPPIETATPTASPTTTAAPTPPTETAPPTENEKEEETTKYISAPTTIELLITETPSFFSSLFALHNDKPDVAFLDGYLSGVDNTMEYITADGYTQYDGTTANNLYWTKLYTDMKKGMQTRPDGSMYMPTQITLAGTVPILSAWYGKTIYVRYQGSEGMGTQITIPAYTDIDYQTGKKQLYKKAVSILSVRVPETGVDFYSTYLELIRNADSTLVNGKGAAVVVTKAPLTPYDGRYRGTSFNENPESYLKDAEGNYRYDSVMLGVNTFVEPDMSQAAAQALKAYINEGYGFMGGHDTLYGYGGVHADSTYAPMTYEQAESKGILDEFYRTPYYVQNTPIDGHYNMNWLIGTNKLYKQESPFNAASMILCSGDYTDKRTLYGDTEISSTMRISTVVGGNPDTDITVRTPTNYPYNTLSNNASGSSTTPIFKGLEFNSNATHTNQQIAYGTVWIDFTSNTMVDLGYGRLITDKRNGLYGTNNFYLTTNGNIAFNQIGHMVTGKAASYAELQLFANSVLYISQRKQCQVCQSEQGGNKEIHFSTTINHGEELAKLADQAQNHFTHPLDGCYMLGKDIVLPNNWQAIKGFNGHFNADGHTITLATNANPVFEQLGTLGEYTDSEDKGWNLGTDSNLGYNSISAANGNRTTGIARIAGYLKQLFKTEGKDWSNHLVEIYGIDGTIYTGVTNIDGKYVISNLPTNGDVYSAKVFPLDSNGSKVAEINQYGNIRAKTDTAFWTTNETNGLYIASSAFPAKNKSGYLETDVTIDGAGINYPVELAPTKWQYLKAGETLWKDMSNSTISYEILPHTFTEKGEDSFTETKLKLKNVTANMDGYKFRAVFDVNGKEINTYDGAWQTGYEGILTVLPRPMYVTDPTDVELWTDETAVYTSTLDYYKQATDDKLVIDWQYRPNMTGNWVSVDKLGGLKYTITNNDIENGGTQNPSLAPHKIESTLTIDSANTKFTDYNFRAVYKYEKTQAQSAMAVLTVKRGTVTATSATEQKLKIGVGGVATGMAICTSDITYTPSSTSVGTPKVGVNWLFSGGKSYTNVTTNTFNQETANAQAAALGLTAAKYPIVTIENSAPRDNGDGSSTITSTLKISNINAAFDEGNTRYYFSCSATAVFNEGYAFGQAPDRAALQLDYDLNLAFNDGLPINNQQDENGDYSMWTFPNLVVDAPLNIYSLILKFDETPRYNGNSCLILNGKLPGDMVRKVSSGHYIILTSVNGVSAAELQEYLRANMQWKTYDYGGGAQIYGYLDCNKNFANKSRSAIPTDVSTFAAGDVTITRHPQSVTLAPNAAAVFSVGAVSNNGEPLVYQWQSSTDGGVSWHNMVGETRDTYSISSTLLIQVGWRFRCVVGTASDPKAATSGAAVLNVSVDKYYSPGVTLSTGNTYRLNTPLLSNYTSCTYRYTMLDYWSADGSDGNVLFIALLGNGSGHGWGWGTASSTFNPKCDYSYIDFEARQTSSIGATGTYRLDSVSLKGSAGSGDREDNNLVRNDHTAFDRSVIFAKSISKPVEVVFTGVSTVYDGSEKNAVATLMSADVPQAELNAILARAKIKYSNMKTTVANTIGSGCIAAGAYGAELVFAENDLRNYAITGDKAADILISKRPIDLVSVNNDKVYDGTTSAAVSGIAPQLAIGDSGIIAADVGNVSINRVILSGNYLSENQTNGVQIKIEPIGLITLQGLKAINYQIRDTNFTGKITQRKLILHSRYLEDVNKIRNVKQYDGTNTATIQDIVIDNVCIGDVIELDKTSYSGIYAQAAAGETLTADGKPQPDRYRKLIQVGITRQEPISLLHNDFDNYVIGAESYAGAISRATLEIRLKEYYSQYGNDYTPPLTTAGSYTSTEVGAGTSLEITKMAVGDTLTLDGAKSGFKEQVAINKYTPAGIYDIEYLGLNEGNYAVLANYVLIQGKSFAMVTPKTLKVTIGEQTKNFGEDNPVFAPEITGFVNGDTAADVITGTLKYATLCDKNSNVRYLSDKKTVIGYEVRLYGLGTRFNANNYQNYTLEFESGTIKVLPLAIIATADSFEKNVGESDPIFTYKLSVPLVNKEDVKITLERVAGEDKGEYPILAKEIESLNYDVTFVPGSLTIFNAEGQLLLSYSPPKVKTDFSVGGDYLDIPDTFAGGMFRNYKFFKSEA